MLILVQTGRWLFGLKIKNSGLYFVYWYIFLFHACKIKIGCLLSYYFWPIFRTIFVFIFPIRCKTNGATPLKHWFLCHWHPCERLHTWKLFMGILTSLNFVSFRLTSSTCVTIEFCTSNIWIFKIRLEMDLLHIYPVKKL